MNKKGIGFPSIFVVFVSVLIIVALAFAQSGSTIPKEEFIDVVNSQALNWSYLGGNITLTLEAAKIDKPNYMVVIISIIEKGIDFFGYSILEISKLAMKIAVDNPDIINYKVLFALLILSLLAPLIYPAFIIIVSLILIIKEWYQNRKEKLALKNHKEVKQ